MNKFVVMCFSLLLILSFVMSVGESTHCLRQDISRWRSVDPTITFTDPSGNILPISPSDGVYTVPINAVLRIQGFGQFQYFCDNGWSPLLADYFDVYDNSTNKIIATNGLNGTNGPKPAGHPICAKTVNSVLKLCYIDGCGPNGLPCAGGAIDPNYVVGALGACSISSFQMGAGDQVAMIIPLSRYSGRQSWSLRLGAISPGGLAPDSPYILPIVIESIDFVVSSTSLLVFSPKPLERMNSFDKNGDFEKEIYFTLLNKSTTINRLSDYTVVCPPGVTCTLEDYNGKKMYKDFILGTDNAIVIPVTVSYSKSNIPMQFDLFMNVSYVPLENNLCNNQICNTSSSPVKFESGLLDLQDFQINVIKNDEQKYCVDSQGNMGQTGAAYAPRVNLYFGGSVPPSQNTDSSLILMNECSARDWNTQAPNSDWVYCSLKEFLVQLGARFGKYGDNINSINSLEQVGRFTEAQRLREENGNLLGFTAYLRESNIDNANIVRAVEDLNTLSNVAFSKLGFAGEVDSFIKLKNLVSGIDFIQTVDGLEINNNILSPGEYRITADFNSTSLSTSGSYLFDSPADTLNSGLNIKVKFEKINSPRFNWFFYYDQNDSFAEQLVTPTSEEKYVTNVIDRGTILYFEKNNSTMSIKNFYSTFAVPLVIRLKDKDINGVSDSEFKVDAYDKDIFTYWTAFASNLSNGCETTSLAPPEGKKVLPYRVSDSNLGNTSREIRELRNVKTNSTMYLGTVLYLPTNENSNNILRFPFRVFTKKGVFDGNYQDYSTVIIMKDDEIYSANKIVSIKDALDGINNETVCVTYDKSTEVEKWNLFWNQDKVIDSLKNDIKSQVLSDSKICASRELMSS